MATRNSNLDDTPLSVFDSITKKIAARNHPHFLGLHQGKTTYPPCANLSKWASGDFELQAHQHASPAGITTLRKAILAKSVERYQRELSEETITITCGATHAISTALKVIVNPGDEVILLAPQWLFAYGLVRAANGIPVEVPVFQELSKNAEFDFISLLEKNITQKTKAIYFNNPNNPTGVLLTKTQLTQLAEFAEKHDIWIIADNAYENYVYTDDGYIDIAERQHILSNRIFSVYTFSKTYAMPGYRVGYIISPESVSEVMRKMSLYSIYSLSTASQFGALQALKTDPEILKKYHLLSKQARDIVANKLVIPSTYAQGGLYTWLDLSAWKNGNTDDFISHCIELGVSLAPGIAFGKEFGKYARLCFTAVNHDDLNIAINHLNNVYNSRN